MRTATDAAAVTAELTTVPAHERVALVDPRFVGHVHALRLALTDPRFPAAAVRGALGVQPEARTALIRAVTATAATARTYGNGGGAPTAAPAQALGSAESLEREAAPTVVPATVPDRASEAQPLFGSAPGPGAEARGGDADLPGAAVASGAADRADAVMRAPDAAHASGEYAESRSRTRPSGAATALGATDSPTAAAPGEATHGASPDRAAAAGVHADAVAPGPATRAGETVGAGHAADGFAAPSRSVAVEAAMHGVADAHSSVDDLAAALDAEGVAVHRPELGVLVADVPADAEARAAACDAVAAVDDERVRLRSAVKARDGFFTTYCISPYSRYIARWCARRGLTPNQVTTASLLTALIAAACAATGTRPGFVSAGVLLIASFVLDCTDGQLARYSLQYSTLGAWLDATFDRAKEYAYYAGLALGAARADGGSGGDDVWALALGAMVLQTCRHVVDFAFNEANHDATGNTSPTAALSGRLDSVGWTVWVRRMIVLPIGERWAMIAVLTAVTTPRITFYVLLIGCALAACYTTAGRVLRSLTRRAKRTDRAAHALAELADSGPPAELVAKAAPRKASSYLAPLSAALGAAAVLAGTAAADFGSWVPVGCAVLYAVLAGVAVAAPLKGPLDWLVPPLFRAAEYGTILILAAYAEVNGALPAAFGLVAAVAYHHYDTVYRIRGGTGAPPRRLVRAIGGHEGRTVVVTAAAALLHHQNQGFTIALTALAAVIALAVLIESIRFWVSSGAPAVHDETGEPA
ncbi:CDP-alcohol phosphatidyltransferase [Streptomyces violaceusniger Tu 4113]|uniref:CDP-alcohol phosphatidyltransferase n=1 Tax=Streptomyces violaceusniger (strain Tu 4113) TaxID=653045 RepID=G2P4D8_STRV4|nr:CDP-alcohol phosphatidyltransferase [Streptomyces violaceusniger Tu 4113]